MLLEICVDTAEGLHIATRNGADRIELCASLGVGGLTPSLGMMRFAAKTGCPTRVMIRPRQGDFVYSDQEVGTMLHDIDAVAGVGLDGVVLGCNQSNGELDEGLLALLTNHAKSAGLRVTLHRSFDIAPNQIDALALARHLGIDAILTSGGKPSAPEGVDMIAKLQAIVDAAQSPIEIMAGVGINADTVGEIVRRCGVRSVHGSCSRLNTDVSRGAEHLGYATAGDRRTDLRLVTELRNALALTTAVGAS